MKAMPSTISFALSSEVRDTDVGSLDLRPHVWLTWHRLYVSPVMTVLDASSQSFGEDAIDDAATSSILRDEICDLVDALSSAGITSPVTLVIQCDRSTYPHWHRLAGDQDWLRGTFAIYPFDPERYVGAGFPDADVFTSFITDAAAKGVSRYSLRNLSEQEYFDVVRARAMEEAKPSSATHQLVNRVLDAYAEAGIVAAGQAIGQPKAKRGVARWLEHDVLARASGFIASDNVGSDNVGEQR